MIWIICIFTLFLGSCEQKPRESHYTEIAAEASSDQPAPAGQTTPVAPHAGNMFSWVVPQGWQQEAGTGMRLATFYLRSDAKAIDCYIITLAGPAGGLDANLARWLEQLGLQASDDIVNQLSAAAQIFKTKDGLEIRVFDFTSLQSQGPASDKSMMAAMVTLDQTTVFIKMTGTIGSVKQNKDNFLKLLGSITRKMT